MLVDWLEELLAALEEKDEEEREPEDALGLGAEAPAPPALEIETGEAPGDGVEEAGAPPAEHEGALAEGGTLEWPPDKRDGIPGVDKGAGAGPDGGTAGAEEGSAGDENAENEMPELLRDEPPWDEPAWDKPPWDGPPWDKPARDGPAAVIGRNGAVVLRRPGAGDVELAGLSGAAVEPAAARELDAVVESMTAAEQGLERLYRQAVQASRPAAQSLPVEQAGRSVRAEEPGRSTALTVDELDRAVRRDSRRYDGGMTIF